jgi:hypothetical protein
VHASNPFHIQEILAIITVALLSYSSVKLLYGSVEAQFPEFYDLQINLIVYSAVISYNYSYNVERGIMGYIFSMPIHRRSFFRNSIFVEILFPVVLIIVPSALIFELTFFSIDFSYLLFVAFLMAAEISLMISAGRVLTIVTRSSILCLILIFAIFYALINFSQYFKSGSFLWMISMGVGSLSRLQPSTYLAEMIAYIFLVAFFLYEISTLLLMSFNLKNGR